MEVSLVPDSFAVPERLETEDFYLRMLTIHDVVKDYDAVMASKDKLRSPNEASASWPDNLTIEQNLIDLAWHQKEFQNRTSFTYTVMALDESRILGCVYIYPTAKADYDAKVEFWARSGSDLDQKLYDTVTNWIKDVWTFSNPAFVGHYISYQDWDRL